MTFQDYTLFFLFASIFFFQIRKFAIDQKISFISNWIVRIAFSGFIACSLYSLQLTSMPISVIILTTLLSIFLFESFRAWRIISILERLELPLFPRFKQISDTIIWPQGSNFESLRMFLKLENFQTVAGLISTGNDNGIALLSSIFINQKQNTLAQVIFSPMRFGKNIVNIALTSQTKDGNKIITHNVNMPFGCLVKNNKYIKRFPLKSAKDIIKKHEQRVSSYDNLTKLENINAAEIINVNFNLFEESCIDLGLCQKSQNSELLCLTQEGSYALWKSILKISYLGMA